MQDRYRWLQPYSFSRSHQIMGNQWTIASGNEWRRPGISERNIIMKDEKKKKAMRGHNTEHLIRS